MAAISVTTEYVARAKRTPLIILYGKGADNSTDTLTGAVPGGRAVRLVHAQCIYDDSPTQAGVTFTINSHIGGDYDTLLSTGSANAQTTVYLPDGEIWLHPGDSLDVAAPAGGAGIGAAVWVVFSEE